jgi:hypothetical protein
MIPNTPELPQAGQVIQAMAQEAGFQLTIQATESASLIQLATKGEYQARLGGWSGRTDGGPANEQLSYEGWGGHCLGLCRVGGPGADCYFGPRW